jgi:hypothetical protein
MATLQTRATLKFRRKFFLFAMEGVAAWRAEEDRSMEEGLYRTRLQELRCIFPANADPRINWRYAWKNYRNTEGSAVQIVPPTKQLFKSEVLCTAWLSGLRRGRAVDMGPGVGSQKLGEPPKCGET